MPGPRAVRIRWPSSYRIIPTRYPPIALFERVADPEDWDALIEIESLTNDRVRDEIGEIRLVPVEQRVSGPGASWVMGAFTHIGWPSRFSDGSYGVYYAAHSLPCAIAETVHHLGKFLAATNEPACDLDMRVLIGGVAGMLHDLRGGSRRWPDVYHLDHYGPAQMLASRLRSDGSKGLIYDSVRLAGVDCIAAFTPRIIRPLPAGDAFLVYHWNGERIDRYWDYAAEQWLAPPSN